MLLTLTPPFSPLHPIATHWLMPGPYLQPKSYSPCSLPFCFSSTFGNSSIIAVSERGWWGTIRHPANCVHNCAYEKQKCQSKLQSKTVLTSPFHGRCDHKDVVKIIPQLFLHDTTGLHFHSFIVFFPNISTTPFGSVNSHYNGSPINTCQTVQKVNGPTHANYIRGPDPRNCTANTYQKRPQCSHGFCQS